MSNFLIESQEEDHAYLFDYFLVLSLIGESFSEQTKIFTFV